MLWRILNNIFTSLILILIISMYILLYVIWNINKDLPDHKILQFYKPNIMSRMYASNGQLLAEYAEKRRFFIPYKLIPKRIIQAIISVEDKNFYKHSGIDIFAFIRAMITNIKIIITRKNKRLIGASTITQQVAKNFLLTNERTYIRKIKEALLTIRIEKKFSKNKILELYLNEIHFGLRSYGIAMAAINYFGVTLNQLTLSQIAYLASLPKAPNNYHPLKNTKKAILRRNYVIKRMFQNNYITKKEMINSQNQPLNVSIKLNKNHIFPAKYFAEDVRKKIASLYGDKKILQEGLSINTTLDPKLQIQARNSLIKGMISYDRKYSNWRGPIAHIKLTKNWHKDLIKINILNDINFWGLAIILKINKKNIKIGLKQIITKDKNKDFIPKIGFILNSEIKWITKKSNLVSKFLKIGDIIYVKHIPLNKGYYELMQIPKISGSIVVMDPHTGRVYALVGGFSYKISQFNRASQAKRQPGSLFKPFVYAVALEKGYTPSSLILDAPYEKKIKGQNKTWKPQNYSKKFYGLSTLRLGIERSRNVMTVRLAENIGMNIISKYANDFGIYNNMNKYLSMSLGAGETTVIKMVAGYSILANGGKKITPILIDKIQNRYGKTIYKYDKRKCTACFAKKWSGQAEPKLIDNRKQIISAMSAYQITSFMEGVVIRGTAKILKKLGKPIAGKTGTTNDYKDAWFIGYTPDLVVGIYLGFDNPKNMGNKQTGGYLAAPVFLDFMKKVLKNKPAIPFRIPNGLSFYRINSKTGNIALSSDNNVILEAFKNGKEPPIKMLDLNNSIDNLNKLDKISKLFKYKNNGINSKIILNNKKNTPNLNLSLDSGDIF